MKSRIQLAHSVSVSEDGFYITRRNGSIKTHEIGKLMSSGNWRECNRKKRLWLLIKTPLVSLMTLSCLHPSSFILHLHEDLADIGSNKGKALTLGDFECPRIPSNHLQVSSGCLNPVMILVPFWKPNQQKSARLHTTSIVLLPKQ